MVTASFHLLKMGQKSQPGRDWPHPIHPVARPVKKRTQCGDPKALQSVLICYTWSHLVAQIGHCTSCGPILQRQGPAE
jgi:hypothetical protein